MYIWDKFVNVHQIAKLGVELFESIDSESITKEIDKKYRRSVHCRSFAMEELILHECDKLVSDWTGSTHKFDGLIYLMFKKRGDGEVIPLSIGKNETRGKGSYNFSVNIQSLKTNKSKFARRGDGHQYHTVDLSAAVLPNYDKSKIQPKYLNWGKALFEYLPTYQPKLIALVYFWAKVWIPSDISIWREFSPTRLTFLEYQLIGVASSLFPKFLLNVEGQNR